MHIILADINEEIVAAWQRFFASIDDVTVYHGSIFDNPADAIVSPANSFGYMDGGIDLHLSEYLGWHSDSRTDPMHRHFGSWHRRWQSAN